MDYFRIVCQIFAEFTHLACRLHTIYVAGISINFAESNCTGAQPCTKIYERFWCEIWEHLFNLCDCANSSGICSGYSIEQIRDCYVLRVFYLRFDRFKVCFSLLGMFFEYFFLACQIDLFYSAMKR